MGLLGSLARVWLHTCGVKRQRSLAFWLRSPMTMWDAKTMVNVEAIQIFQVELIVQAGLASQPFRLSLLLFCRYTSGL